MGDFANIELKEMSTSILVYLSKCEAPVRASEIAEGLELGTRQVDAAITKSLVRYGFVVREAKLTRVLKKEYNMIRITDRGKRYVNFLEGG